jgi:hypothetical protein
MIRVRPASSGPVRRGGSHRGSLPTNGLQAGGRPQTGEYALLVAILAVHPGPAVVRCLGCKVLTPH